MRTQTSRLNVTRRRNVLIPLGIALSAAIALAVPHHSLRSTFSGMRGVAPARSNQVNQATKTSFGNVGYPAPINSLLSAADPFQSGTESIATFDSTCTTPQDSFNLGDTVCAIVTNAPLAFEGRAQRRVGWVSPYGSLTQGVAVATNPQQGFYTIPTSQTQTFTDTEGNTFVVDNRGTWKVGLYSNLDGALRTTARFTVHDPATPNADLAVSQTVTEQNSTVNAGSNSVFSVFATNRGPDTAQNVVLTDVVPANTTFSALVQTSGPTFTCSTPAVGAAGTVTCTISGLAPDEVASFDLAFTVSATAPAGTVISNTASITSDTNELVPDDNSNTSTALVVAAGGGTGDCSIGCPEDISTTANTTQGSQDGAIVHFSTPSGDDTCGTISVNHCNDCFFPVGVTTVTATSASGDSCSFTVTVRPQQGEAPTISCPGNQSGNADASCHASFTIGTATATGGSNVTIIGTRSDGEPMYTCDDFGNCTRNATDAPFTYGVTTITWVASSHDIPGPYNAQTGDEESHGTGSTTCTQVITVNDVTPPSIGATSQTVSADASCQAVIPDFSSTVSDNCSSNVSYTQTPAAGTVVGLGAHTVHIEANDNSSNNGGNGNAASKDITVTVVDTTPPTFTFVPPSVTAYTGPGATSCDTVISDATLGTATATDNCSSVTITRSPSGNTFPVGTTSVIWTATDGAGNSSTATQAVTVIDNTAPIITVNGNTPSMWPPNHKYQTFGVTNFVTSVFDNCGGVSVSSVVIDHVTSDEAENGNGDGNTTNDIIISSDCKSVQLRSERDGSGDGRVYTITFRLTDTHGNTTTATSKVVVAHNPGETPVDSGVHYTVNGGCP